jgi:anti-anti-sigma factor
VDAVQGEGEFFLRSSAFRAGGAVMSSEPRDAETTGLRLRTQTQGDETVIQCIGRLTIEHAEVLKRHGKSVIPQTKRLVLDMKDVVWMDSAGIGALVGLYVSAKKAGCEFILVNYNKTIRDLLGITHLLSVFETCAKAGMRMP